MSDVEPHCRVKRYRLKTGGEVVVLGRSQPMKSWLLHHAKQHVDQGNIEAYAIVSFRQDAQGCDATVSLRFETDSWRLHHKLFPSAVKEALQSYLRSEATVTDVPEDSA